MSSKAEIIQQAVQKAIESGASPADARQLIRNKIREVAGNTGAPPPEPQASRYNLRPRRDKSKDVFEEILGKRTNRPKGKASSKPSKKGQTARAKTLNNLPEDMRKAMWRAYYNAPQIPEGMVKDAGRIAWQQSRKGMPDFLKGKTQRLVGYPRTQTMRNINKNLNKMDRYYVQPIVMGAGLARGAYGMLKPSFYPTPASAPASMPTYQAFKGSVYNQAFGKRGNITKSDVTDFIVRQGMKHGKQYISPYLHLDALPKNYKNPFVNQWKGVPVKYRPTWEQDEALEIVRRKRKNKRNY
jgi:hypothetical protein